MPFSHALEFKIENGIKWRRTLANVHGSTWTNASIKEEKTSWVERLVYNDFAGSEDKDKEQFLEGVRKFLWDTNEISFKERN